MMGLKLTRVNKRGPRIQPYYSANEVTLYDVDTVAVFR